MSTRRRIKAAAILPPKRPTRDSSAAASAPKQVKVEPKLEVKSEPKVEVKTESDVPTLPPVEKVPPIELKSPDKPVPVADKVPVDSYATSTELAANEVVAVVQESIDLTDNDLFKSPPVLANHRRTESFSASDAEYDRNEDLGAHKLGAQGPPSPVKFRQRIRPTPFFGMRRNSTQVSGAKSHGYKKLSCPCFLQNTFTYAVRQQSLHHHQLLVSNGNTLPSRCLSNIMQKCSPNCLNLKIK